MTEEERRDLFTILPEEIIISFILPNLTIPDITVCKLVSRKWLHLIRRYYRSIKDLDLSPWDFMVTEDYLVNIVKYAKALRRVILTKCWRACSDTSLYLIASTCKQLQVINVSHCGSVTDSAVGELAKNCKDLREIDLSSCYKITDSAMCSLANDAKKLQELYVSSVYGVTDYGISQISFKGLKVEILDISYCFRVSNKGLVGMLKRGGSATSLKSLRIKGCSKVTDDFILQLWQAGVEVNNMF